MTSNWKKSKRENVKDDYYTFTEFQNNHHIVPYIREKLPHGDLANIKIRERERERERERGLFQ